MVHGERVHQCVGKKKPVTFRSIFVIDKEKNHQYQTPGHLINPCWFSDILFNQRTRTLSRMDFRNGSNEIEGVKKNVVVICRYEWFGIRNPLSVSYTRLHQNTHQVQNQCVALLLGSLSIWFLPISLLRPAKSCMVLSIQQRTRNTLLLPSPLLPTCHQCYRPMSSGHSVLIVCTWESSRDKKGKPFEMQWK